MTTRLKTVEYAFDSNRANLAAATTFTFGAITLTIPETSGRVFKSVYIDITIWDACTATTQTMTTNPTVGIQLAAVAFSDTTITPDLTNSPCFGNNDFQVHYLVDVTAYFVSNFGAGTSQTAGVRFNIPGSPTSNQSAKLVITYEYDETNTTRAKTVRIPLEGYSGQLPSAQTQIGSATEIPNLSTFLPEASVTIENIWFEISTQLTWDVVTAFTLNMSIDAGATVSDYTHQTGAAPSTGDKAEYFLIWQQNALSTSATHAFKLGATRGTIFANPVVIMHVTYTYNHSTSTTVLNSLILPLRAFESVTTPVSTDAAFYTRKFFVEEASPTLVQSAVVVRIGIDNSTDALGGPWTDTPSMLVGSQTARTYFNPFSVSGGCRGFHVISQRIDSGGVQGAGITLARGENLLQVHYYGSADMPTKMSNAVCYLNYKSSINANGDGAHNHTIRWLYWATQCQGPANATPYVSKFTPTVIDIPEANYWITSMGAEPMTGGAQGGVRPPWSAVQVLAAEQYGGGWFVVQHERYEAFDRPFITHSDLSDFHKRSSEDVDPLRMNFKNSRLGRSGSGWAGGCYTSFVLDYTYHSIQYTVSGTISNFSGGGSGITVDLHRADTGERMASTTTAGGGTYTMPWYDNTINVYTEAYQDGTHIGRSTSSTAV